MAEDSDKEFKIKLTGPGLALDQAIGREVAGQLVALVLGGVATGPSIPKSRSEPISGRKPEPAAESPTPKGFMLEKKPQTDAQKIVCLAYYLRHYRSVKEFKTADLTELNKEAQQRDFSNASVTTNNAMRDALFGKAGASRKQITAKGESVVDALPDQVKVKEAASKHGKPKQKGRKVKKAA